MKNKQKNKAVEMLKILIIFFIAIIIVLSVLIMSFKSINKRQKDSISNETTEVEKKREELEKAKKIESDIITEKLADKGERDRMEYYFSKFLKSIESKKYEQAYEMLYEDFRKNYFPTLSSFEEYVKKTFPKMANIEHTNIERSGENYILFVTITDSLSSTNSEGKEMKIVIREYNLNDFVMSFSVI